MLPERLRTRLEEAGRVDLGDADAAALARTKLVHTVVILVAVLAAVSVSAYGGMGFWTAIIGFPFLAFWAGGVAEAFGVGRSVSELAKAVGWTTGAALLGMLGFFLLLGQSMPGGTG